MATTGGSISLSSFPSSSFCRKAKPILPADSLELRHLKTCKCKIIVRNLVCFAAQESSSVTGNFSLLLFCEIGAFHGVLLDIQLIIDNTTSCWGEERVSDCWRKTKAKGKGSRQASTSDDGGGCYSFTESNSWISKRHHWAWAII